ncbi:hypothetical protein KLMIMM162B_29475 [Klebsiella michiganensis]
MFLLIKRNDAPNINCGCGTCNCHAAFDVFFVTPINTAIPSVGFVCRTD